MTKATAAAAVAVLGASPKPNRFSFKAVRMLKEYGYNPIPVHPAGHMVDSVPGVRSLNLVKGKPDTLTVYVNPKVSSELREEILKLKPRRVIFNPGAENEELAAELQRCGIEVVEACTLVMLRTGEF